jgi:DNA-binding beta-propeller fold protein YncE
MSRRYQTSRKAVVGLAGAALTVAVVLIVGGCATAPKQVETKLVWPPPPGVARIQFVRSIVSDEDLEHDTTATQKILNLLGGDKPSTNQFAEPTGIAVSEDGNRIYVSDIMQRAVYIFDFGNKSFFKIDSINAPGAVALDAQENLYVVETLDKKIAVYGRDRNQIKEITDPSVERPVGIAIDKQRGRIYLVDTGTAKTTNFTVKIFDLDGKLIGHIGNGQGVKPGQFIYPTYACVDSAGNVYVSDSFNGRVQKFDPDGKYLMTYGQRGDAWGEFDKPKGVAVDGFGNLYVVDAGWSNVQIFNPKGQILLFFGGRGGYPGLLRNPNPIAIDKHNRIYVGDFLNARVEVYDLVNTTAADSYLEPPPGKPGASPGAAGKK